MPCTGTSPASVTRACCSILGMSRTVMWRLSPELIKRLFLDGDWARAVPVMTVNKAISLIEEIFISRLAVVTRALVTVELVERYRVSAHTVHHNSDISAFHPLKGLVCTILTLFRSSPV